MKKFVPYSLIFVLAAIVVMLIVAASNKKTFDKRVSLSYKQKHPYGTNVLYQLLPILLPNTKVEVNKKSPNEWFYKNDSAIDNSLFIVVTQHFNPAQSEIELLDRFVRNGNSVMIVSPKMNEVALNYFDLSLGGVKYYLGETFKDSSTVMLNKPVFNKDTSFFYPGYTFETFFTNFDTSAYYILGNDASYKQPNFLQASIKNGRYYLHTNPFIFSNYFILHKNNRSYLEKSFALIPPNTKHIIWDEYFVYKLNENEQPKDPSPLRILLSITAFKWAIGLAIAILALYLLLHFKRNQRVIPLVEKPKNESLAFVKTIGRLYFEKQDHLNLAQQMCAYFLEFVRSKYFINTNYLNAEFVQKLSGKSGLPEAQIEVLIVAIEQIQLANTITQEELANYYQLFNQFYKNTA